MHINEVGEGGNNGSGTQKVLFFWEPVGFFEVFLFSMCSNKRSLWVLNIFQK
jgi:hypothetical protein